MELIKNIVVIGASAGGLPAIRQVISGLTNQSDIAVLVVLHLSQKSNPASIVNLFQKVTSLTCNVAENGIAIQKGHLYLAPPDHHLLLKNNKLLINQGPHENKYRPAIDVLFRSAAVSFGHKVIGIILTGLLEDGTSGMSAVKRCGGICIVQDPAEAQYADMPLSVLNHIKVNYQLPLADISLTLNKIFTLPLPPEVPVPSELQIEADITENRMSTINQLKKIGEQSDFICPDCGGGLWALKNDPTHRYRCYTGHVYTENILHELQGTNIEESIYVSIRMLEERHNLLSLMATHALEAGNTDLSSANKERADETQIHIDRLKTVLTKLTENLNR